MQKYSRLNEVLPSGVVLTELHETGQRCDQPWAELSCNRFLVKRQGRKYPAAAHP